MTAAPDCPVFVSADVVRRVFEWKDAIAALQAAYGHAFTEQAAPSRSIAQSEGAWLRTLPAAPPGGRYYGAKLMGADMKAADPSVEYVVVLFERATSRIAGFVDANLLTGFRTAATSGAALDRLAPEGPGRLALIGSGLEATMHVRAFASVRPLSEVTIYSPTPEKRAAFAEAVTRDLGVPARAVQSGEEAVEGADLVLSAARSRGEVPILFGDWLKPGATIVSIGSTVPSQREIDVSVADRADFIVCDNLHEVVDETGDMIAALDAGIDVRSKSFSLNQLLSGQIEAQRQAAAMPMYKSVGGGVQDVVVAEMILTKAIEQGLAQPLPMTFDPKHL
ncbi:ornithine cyclodeaminase [Novosphingobium endophyticum]|uniref:Ornithine cyclodeaminase n=1 Tax=Novosphingobium endophyticum TaxID=1955250 RepID=A0A916TTJ4_9SPHN|nr:ornithine cyclodeaminase family protein [Novosphingobium endophyticum]GGC01377.1 ornithine cyclodeaminase [Novosphingobium endophyticum]